MGTSWLIIAFLSSSFNLFGQETNSHVSGIVKSEKNEILQRATVIAVHEPTKNIYKTQTNVKGYFHFFNIKPGGPYSITISYTGFESLSKSGLYLSYSAPNFYSYLQANEFSEFTLKEKNNILDEVIINAKKQAGAKYGTETNLNNQQIQSLPSISRNLQDYARMVPQAKVNGDGMISLAGQNNKFNTFFIDGSSNNDILGLAVSGINGGQTNSPPISIESIEEFKVSLSPFDVQYSNFTGGSINAITKSGSNKFKSSAWYYFRNEKMAGRSPVPIENPGLPGIFERTRLSSFSNQTTGVSASGPFIQNKLFYFLLAEKQNDLQPQPYNFSEYKGISSLQQITNLADTVRKRYGYDPGSFLESGIKLDATRFVIKLDWNPGLKTKITFSYRYNNAERINPQPQSSGTVIRFSNNRFRISSKINSVSLELKNYFKGSANNRLLISYNNDVTDRKIVGQPFPTVVINDGLGTIGFGSHPTGQLNLFKASELNLLNIFRFIKNKQTFSAGIDLNFSKLDDIALGGYYGQYTFRNMSGFLANAFPMRYSRTVSLIDSPSGDKTKASAFFSSLRTGIFINDEIQLNENLQLSAGIRVDVNTLPSKYKQDVLFATVVQPEIEKYYDLQGAVSGRYMKNHPQLSPRFGFNYKIPDEKITIRGGAGLFSGHILNVWASEIFNRNSYNINITSYNQHFNPDPFNQPNLQTLGINPDNSKAVLYLVARDYKYPTVFRTSLSADKKLNRNWTFTTEILFTKNIHENRYTDVSLIPSEKVTPLPDRRNVYSLNTAVTRIPIASGTNPYNGIILLANNRDKKGFSYSFSGLINKSIGDNLSFNIAYTYGKSIALCEPTGTANGNGGQWLVETVNGKNIASRSVSDFDLGHRVYATITRKFSYGNWHTLITLFYNGQSGSPYSYVYNGSILNDAGQQSNYDLIYIPTKDDLENMTFIPNAYSALVQKQSLNEFIESDRYLRKHRGQFAERNGARLPFTHTIDLRIQQDLKIKLKKKETRLSLIYDIFNFTQMLNKNWGRTYFLSNDQYALISFVGFENNTTLKPQYQFTPFSGKPWTVQNSTAPGNSARWISQLGIKIYFD